MKIGQLLIYKPQYPRMRVSLSSNDNYITISQVVMLIKSDFVGFKSEVLIDDKKVWVRNSELFEMITSDMEEQTAGEQEKEDADEF